MAYLGSHRRSVNRRINASIADITTGLIAEITYQNAAGEVSVNMYLILDARFMKRVGGKIHALNLDGVAPYQLYYLFKYTDDKRPVQREIRNIKYTKYKFNIKHKQLYEQGIKNEIVRPGSDNYRLLDKLNIRKVTIIDYKWDEQRFKGRKTNV